VVTGHGASEGTPEDSTPEQQVHDLAAALDMLETLDDAYAHRIGVTVGAPAPRWRSGQRLATRASVCSPHARRT
jgi:hypothetical protein